MRQIIVNGTHKDIEQLLKLAARGFANDAGSGVMGLADRDTCGDKATCPMNKRCSAMHGTGDVAPEICLQLLTEYYLGGE